MSRKCTRKLQFRWALLTIGLGEFFMLAFWLVEGRLPLADTLMVWAEEPVHVLPLQVTRLIDPFIAAALVACFVWVCFNCRTIERYDYPVEDAEQWQSSSDFEASTTAAIGVVLGICGSWLIYLAGVQGAVIGTAVCSAIIVLATYAMSHPKRHPILWFFTEAMAVGTIWFFSTWYHGAVAGAIYALTCLMVAAIVHFGLYWTVNLVIRLKQPFIRTMLSCDISET